MTRSIQILVSLIISAVAVWYSVADVEFGRFVEDFADASFLWVLPMVFSAVLAMVLRAWRWREILTTLAPLKKTPVFDATNIGFMGNMILPLRAGEVLKPLVVAHAGEISAPAAFASVALERICDMLMLGILGVVAVVLVPQGEFLRAQLPAMLAVVGGVLVILVVTVYLSDWLEQQFDWIADRLPAFFAHIVREGGRGGLQALSGLSQPRMFVRVLGLSLLVWLAAAGGFMAAAMALHIDAPLVALGIATAVVVAVAVSIPSAPGFIGVFWAGSEIALSLFGVDKSMGFTFGVLNWIVQMGVICSMGLWSMSRLKLSLSDLRRGAQSDEAETEVG
ncbi:MAG: lysylphosphatidylglycerol synthase transmembrane domain-containing protein [bacterium]